MAGASEEVRKSEEKKRLEVLQRDKAALLDRLALIEKQEMEMRARLNPGEVHDGLQKRREQAPLPER
eukprot:8304757-Pyramimonas_sp.AAC.1